MGVVREAADTELRDSLTHNDIQDMQLVEGGVIKERG